MVNVYSHPLIYHLCMRILYGRHFSARYEVISQQIPPRSQVVDVCCGDAYLYTHYLKQKNVDYLGLDINPIFIQSARRQGIPIRDFDLWKDSVPKADVIVMQASLYHFIPHHHRILEKLLTSARDKIIVAEPIQNLSSLKHPIIATLAKRLSAPGHHEGNAYSGERFDVHSLTKLFSSFEEFRFLIEVPGGKELAGVFDGRAG